MPWPKGGELKTHSLVKEVNKQTDHIHKREAQRYAF